MRTYFRLAVLFPALLVVVPVLAQKKTAAPASDTDPAKIRAKILQDIAKTGKFTCKITGLPDDLEAPEKIFEATVEHEVKTRNPEGKKKYEDCARQYYQARRQRNYQQAKKLYEEAMGLYAASFDIERTPFAFKLIHRMAGEAKKDAKEEKTKAGKTGKTAPRELLIRREVLPPKDPDNPKARYTPAELKELKGPGNHPGYAATLKDIDNDTTVIVYVDKTKWKPPAPAKKKKKGDEEPAAEEKPIPIVMIMIAKPPPGPVGNPLLGGGK